MESCLSRRQSPDCGSDVKDFEWSSGKPVKGLILKSGMIRFAALKNMLTGLCLSLHQMFIAHLCVRHNVENGLEWMKGYQLGCCWRSSGKKMVVGLSHVVAVGAERAAWSSEIVGRISSA